MGVSSRISPLYISISKFQVDIDFEFLHPGKQLSLFDKWDSFATKFSNCYANVVKDKYIKIQLGNKLAIADLGKGEFTLQLRM
jgi:hypothetical protein